MSDVGRLAGVSSTAVSFVINGKADGVISADTQQRVLDAVQQLGYRRNLAAVSLRTRRTRTIGFVTDEIAVKGLGGQSIAGAHDVARHHGSVLLIANATRDSRVLRRVTDDLIERHVDAIVFAVVGTRRATMPPGVGQVPIVLVNCFVAANALPSILPDELGGGRDATALAIDAGHRRIAFATGYPGAWATRERLKGYRIALEHAGVAYDERFVVPGNFRADSGYELTKRLLTIAQRPTAILFGNDLMALGGYFALQEAGLRVPEDMSVIGYDDLPDLAADLRPALTTVRLPYYEMGRLAVERLFVTTSGVLPARQYVPCPLVSRASVAPLTPEPAMRLL